MHYHALYQQVEGEEVKILPKSEVAESDRIPKVTNALGGWVVVGGWWCRPIIKSSFAACLQFNA